MTEVPEDDADVDVEVTEVAGVDSPRAIMGRRHDRSSWSTSRSTLICADDSEVVVDKDVVRPVDADVVDLVLAVAELHDSVDETARVGGQGGFRCVVRCRSADDRARPLAVARGDLTDLLCGRGRVLLERDNSCRRGL